MQLRERIRAESLVQRLNWRLSWAMVPARRQREVVRELRAHLEDAAEAGDLDQAVDRLGDARTLADSYLEVMRPRVRWWSGVLWAVIAFVLVMWLGLFASMAFSAGVDAALDGGTRFEFLPGLAFDGTPLFVDERTPQGDRMAATWSLLTPVHLAAMALAFVLASKPWRLRRRDG